MGRHEVLVGAGTLCTMTIQGHTYPEMEIKARQYAARFFGCEETDLIVVDPTHARVKQYAQFSETAGEPDVWEASFTIGIHWPEGTGEEPGDND
jgi:hypothetical protein